MSQGEIRIGVVGLRFGREVHVPAFRSLAGCRVVALAGTNAGRAAAAAAEMPGVRGYGSWRDMLAAGGIDAVSIAVPPSAQAEIAVAAAESGLAVFCDKPAAADVSQAEAMLGAVRRHGVAHAINFLFPEIPAWRAARAALGDLAAGRPQRQAALTWRVETYAHRHDLRDGWKRSAAAGGGVLSMFVSHSIYYLEWLFGPLRSVLARLLPSADDDAHVTAWLDFDSGLHATLDVAMNCPFGSGHRLEVYGHEGGLVLANSAADYARGFELQVRSRGPSPPHVPETIPGTDDGRIWATARIAERFLQRIRQGGDGGPDLHDGLRVQRILEAIQASQRTGHWVEAPRGDDRT